MDARSWPACCTFPFISMKAPAGTPPADCFESVATNRRGDKASVLISGFRGVWFCDIGQERTELAETGDRRRLFRPRQSYIKQRPLSRFSIPLCDSILAATDGLVKGN